MLDNETLPCTQTSMQQPPSSASMEMTREPATDDYIPAGGPGPVAEAKTDSPGNLIWEGSTWDACPVCCGCLAPLCCVSKHWTITDQVINTRSGCCGSKEDSLYIKRMRDISYEGNCLKRYCCCGLASIVIYSSDQTHPELRLRTFGAHSIYLALRNAWQGGADKQQVDVLTG